MLFVDTGAFLALYNNRDQYHSTASARWKQVARERLICVTSNFVLNETFTLLARRAGYRFAAARARSLYASETLTIVRPTHEDEISALAFFEKYADQEIGFTDCISFALMHKRRIRDVFSFDHHFARAGFELWS